MEKITNAFELQRRINHLELVKNRQEEEIKEKVDDFIHSLSPSELIKNTLSKVGANLNSLTLGNIGFGLLSRVLGGKKKSVVGAVKMSLAVEAAHLFYDKYQDEINGFVGKLGGTISNWFSARKEKKQQAKKVKDILDDQIEERIDDILKENH